MVDPCGRGNISYIVVFSVDMKIIKHWTRWVLSPHRRARTAVDTNRHQARTGFWDPFRDRILPQVRLEEAVGLVSRVFRHRTRHLDKTDLAHSAGNLRT